MKVLFNSLNAALPPILWAGVIFLLSSQPVLPSFSVSVYDFLFKKCSHIFVFAVLYVLLYRAVNFPILGVSQVKKPKNWLLPILLCVLYSLSDELHQSFVPYRTSSLRDVGYDSLGVGLAFLKMYQYI